MNTEMDKAAAAHKLIIKFEHAIEHKRVVNFDLDSSQYDKEHALDIYLSTKTVLNTALCQGVPVEYEVIREIIEEVPSKPPVMGMILIYIFGMIVGLLFGWQVL